MLIIRPVAEPDLDPLADLVALTRGAITTLPPDRKLLSKRLRQSLAAFADPKERPGGEMYTFILEDTRRKGTLLGTASVVSKTGGFEPFYYYEVHNETYASDVLNVSKEVRSLHLIEDHNGPAEVGGLFLRPGVRGGGFGRMLGVARMLFMAGRPQSFEQRVVAEVRGVTDEDGNSPFWNAVGRHFFGVDFAVADAMSFKEKQIIADLMPDHPIYIDMLPKSGRDVIGVEHDFATPARKLLESEGFSYRNRVDIFDAGPMLECELSKIRGVAESKVATVTKLIDADDERADSMVSNDSLAFRACPAVVREEGEGVTLSEKAASAIGVGVGDTVRHAALRPSAPSRSDEVDLYASIPLPRES